MDQVKVGKLIAKLRKKQNLTQAQLGEKLGVTDKTVSKWERGTRTPDISILNDLSSVLNITTTELLNGEQIHKISTIKQLKDNYSETQYFKDISAALLLFLNNNYDDCYVNLIQSQDSKYYINGLIVGSKEKEFININFVENISNYDTKQELIYSYEYSLNMQNGEIYKIGNILLYEHHNRQTAIPINDILNEIRIHITKYNNNDIIADDISKGSATLIIKYINQKLEERNMEIPLTLNRIFSNNKILYDFVKYF